jgi:hypothetical protein
MDLGPNSLANGRAVLTSILTIFRIAETNISLPPHTSFNPGGKTMSEDYRPMWQELGLNLEAHDALLAVLGDGYEQIFLSQENRPKGMDYFNFVVSEVHGLRIKELQDAKAEGRKVIGSFCVFVPEEIVLAADGVLVGLCSGADFAMEEVEKYLPRNTCALIKSAFGFKLGKVCPYLESADMIVGENTCDGKKKSYETLDTLVPNLYVMDLPQVKSGQGKELLAAEYQRFKGNHGKTIRRDHRRRTPAKRHRHGQRQAPGLAAPV